jgi:demethylspheroidene O-methyltransferase|tara:strand:- start:2719 stop:3846 length:1128 start_codon:yes stop_codon:yes gene_type:complete
MILKEKINLLYQSYYRLKVNAFASTKLHNAISKVPILRALISYEGNKIHEIMSGFVYSQILHLLITLNIFLFLKKEGRSLDEVSEYLQVTNERSLLLLRGGCALNLICHKRNKYWLTRMGAQIVGIPGLMDMIQHNQILYRDLIDPVKLFLRGNETELSHFWPYVRKEASKKQISTKVSAEYSRLMQTSQRLVAEQTLQAYSFRAAKRILDIGGGTGAFLRAVKNKYPQIEATVFDLPNVIKVAKSNQYKIDGLGNLTLKPGDFLEDDLPRNQDVICLVRVLYDHEDSTIEILLKRIYKALPKQGVLLITEPMSGGTKAMRSSDCYFSFYTLAMTTGKVRSFEEHKAILQKSGFSNITKHVVSAPFITQVITAKK